ncbi:GapR family DNA-binding domain-containing protein [Sinorhizobium psoraleae]|uniref:DUF2312 domain-containing protein n=1 Tax=Sinorhizobium psoraleae TaxID=520838 RepID=A0ABT4KDB2_9HYPH|nr:GapR family DNA-binding domain-containing protein [Sinorhizobium psoraleae]MCZ4089356.1 DUF2312 domain-containing protein [Sinorhizobium psoraleae]
MSSDGQLKAFIDRVLRLKEEQDALGQDIRDIYAEAKASGFDKTVMGDVVAYLRKLDKKGRDAIEERGAIFETYLAAYERPSHVHAREGNAYADAKLVETVAAGVQTEIGRKALIAAVDIMIAREEAEETHERPSTNDEASPEAGPQAEASPAGTGAGTLADREGRREGEAVSADLPTNSEIPSDERETDREAATTHAGANAGGEDVDRSAKRATAATSSGPEAERASDSPEQATQVRSASTDAPETPGKQCASVVSKDEAGQNLTGNPFTAKPRSALRPHCLNPGEACGGYGSNHCNSCIKAMREREGAAA